jgi:hypothetical protein
MVHASMHVTLLGLGDRALEPAGGALDIPGPAHVDGR